MKVVDFEECNVTWAKSQDEYNTLPAHKTKDGQVTTCYSLSFRERLRVLWYGRVYITQLTFNKPLQPQRPSTTFKIDGTNQQ